jgi:hypothetical protein
MTPDKVGFLSRESCPQRVSANNCGRCAIRRARLWRAGIAPEMRFPIALAILWSGVIGYLSIWGMIRYVRVRSLIVFVVYRVIAGAAILLIWYMGLV